jgi:ADP-ribose pyrophosphatase
MSAESAAGNRRVLLTTSRFEVVEQEQPSPRGGMAKRQFIVHPGAVVILPLADDDRVCLIRNERIAIGKTLIELPAGTLEPPHGPRATAEKELKEETGYTAARWRELPGFYTSPGLLSERMHVFLAEGLTDGDPEREPGENIENYIVPWREAVAMALRGEIEDAKSIAALLMWDRLRKS